MKQSTNGRLEKLEQQTGTNAPLIIVDWSEDPGPPEPGLIVITWDDIEGGTDDEARHKRQD